MIGHLGTRVSALLDGQLSDAETERAWAHVHTCHLCRDAVEREGWIKTRLAGLASGRGSAPAHLKGSLLSGTSPVPSTVLTPRPRRTGMVVLGGSAAGVAVLGVIALGVGSGEVPVPDRRAPVTDLGGGATTLEPVPTRIPGAVFRPVPGRPSR